jgi:hypothetical protein
MKHAKPVAPIKRDEGRLSVHGILRVATLLALGATISILSITFFSTDPQLWQFSGLLLLGTIATIWVFTITIGCCMLIPVNLWRIHRRLSRTGGWRPDHRGRVWDRWIDGPDPASH